MFRDPCAASLQRTGQPKAPNVEAAALQGAHCCCSHVAETTVPAASQIFGLRLMSRIFYGRHLSIF
jgi:hypothetical protein